MTREMENSCAEKIRACPLTAAGRSQLHCRGAGCVDGVRCEQPEFIHSFIHSILVFDLLFF